MGFRFFSVASHYHTSDHVLNAQNGRKPPLPNLFHIIFVYIYSLYSIYNKSNNQRGGKMNRKLWYAIHRIHLFTWLVKVRTFFGIYREAFFSFHFKNLTYQLKDIFIFWHNTKFQYTVTVRRKGKILLH